MNVLANFSSSVHFDSFSIEFREFKFNRTTWVGGGDLEKEFKLVLDQVVGVGAGTLPLGAFFVGLNFEPVVVAVFVSFDISDKRFELFFESVFPFLVFGAGVDRQKRYFVSCLLYGGHHFCL